MHVQTPAYLCTSCVLSLLFVSLLILFYPHYLSFRNLPAFFKRERENLGSWKEMERFWEEEKEEKS